MLSVGTTLPVNSSRVRELVSSLNEKYHTTIEPVQLEKVDGGPTISICRVVPGNPEGLDKPLLAAALDADFLPEEVLVRVVASTEEWE